jgi:hypothetical protein
MTPSDHQICLSKEVIGKYVQPLELAPGSEQVGEEAVGSKAASQMQKATDAVAFCIHGSSC